jgi:hypothetical protein
MRHLLLGLLFVHSFSFAATWPDWHEIDDTLNKSGLTGWIHASNPGLGQFVFTYRSEDRSDPMAFFKAVEISLIPSSKVIRDELTKLNRHDKIRVHGILLDVPSVQRHILLQKINVLEVYSTTPDISGYAHATKIPADLKGKTEIIAKVHTSIVSTDPKREGILVIEYGDAVLPVRVKNSSLVAGLYRNDKIKISFKLAGTPHSPTHLILDEKAAKPLSVLESIVDKHETKTPAKGLVGSLIMYPKSPQVRFDIYALNVVDSDGVARDFTLLNFDPVIFEAIRKSLDKIWTDNSKNIVKARNKWHQPKTILRIHGEFNIVSPNQANPQILLDSEKMIEIEST